MPPAYTPRPQFVYHAYLLEHTPESTSYHTIVYGLSIKRISAQYGGGGGGKV